MVGLLLLLIRLLVVFVPVSCIPYIPISDTRFGLVSDDMEFLVLFRYGSTWKGPNFGLDLVLPNTLLRRLVVLDCSIVECELHM